MLEPLAARPVGPMAPVAPTAPVAPAVPVWPMGPCGAGAKDMLQEFDGVPLVEPVKLIKVESTKAQPKPPAY